MLHVYWYSQLQLTGVSAAIQTITAHVLAQPFLFVTMKPRIRPFENGAMRLHSWTSDAFCTDDAVHDDDDDDDDDYDAEDVADADDGDDDDTDDVVLCRWY